MHLTKRYDIIKEQGTVLNEVLHRDQETKEMLARLLTDRAAILHLHVRAHGGISKRRLKMLISLLQRPRPLLTPCCYYQLKTDTHKKTPQGSTSSFRQVQGKLLQLASPETVKAKKQMYE